MKTYKIQVFGCAMNISDGERIKTVMDKYGFKQTNKNPDVLILVACSVRQTAIDRIWGLINKTKNQEIEKICSLGREGEKKEFVVLTGCVLPDDKKKFEKRVDLLVDIKEVEDLPKMIKRCGFRDCEEHSKATKEPNNRAVSDRISRDCFVTSLRSGSRNDSDNYFHIKAKHNSKFSALVPIMTGCNNFCTYCAVPYTRGREYSRPVENILKEIKELVDKGYKEIILLGQNVNSYRGKFLIFNFKFLNNFQFPISKFKNKTISFPELLRMVNAIPGDFWIRFFTSHPKDLSDELIKAMAECDKVCEYLNLPVQSGDNTVLKKMNRKYTVGHYKKLIKKLRQAVPEITLSTDVIVGFPGETENQFQNTAKLFQDIKYDMAYTAQYSPRPNTAAAKLKDNVAKQEKKRREKILTETLRKTALANNKKYLGKEVEVLVENETKDGKYFGKSRGYKHVKFESGRNNNKSKNLIGKIVKVKVNKVQDFSLEAEII